jgi:hypothetical protein
MQESGRLSVFRAAAEGHGGIVKAVLDNLKDEAMREETLSFRDVSSS